MTGAKGHILTSIGLSRLRRGNKMTDEEIGKLNRMTVKELEEIYKKENPNCPRCGDKIKLDRRENDSLYCLVCGWDNNNECHYCGDFLVHEDFPDTKTVRTKAGEFCEGCLDLAKLDDDNCSECGEDLDRDNYEHSNRYHNGGITCPTCGNFNEDEDTEYE